MWSEKVSEGNAIGQPHPFLADADAANEWRLVGTAISISHIGGDTHGSTHVQKIGRGRGTLNECLQ